jgi:hypothetical protein
VSTIHRRTAKPFASAGAKVREPGKTAIASGGFWMCDFFELTAAKGEGNLESLNLLPGCRHEFTSGGTWLLLWRGLRKPCSTGPWHRHYLACSVPKLSHGTTMS